MPEIHLIEKEGFIKKLGNGNWESGYWHLSVESAESLMNGDIYFHKAQDKRSYFGGKLVNYRIQDEGQWKDRIIFEFTATNEHKNIRTSRDGWAMEKKIVWG